jgi:thiol-disulfide isomerase/thioredoxin
MLLHASLLMLFAAACGRGPSDPSIATGGAGRSDAGGLVRLLRDPKPVPDFTVTDLDGRRIRSSDLRGKVVIVNFWATWCPPCRAEIPDLNELQDKYRDQLVVLGISEDEAPVEIVKRFMADYRVNYTVAMTSPELRKVFRGVVALPTTFVIDREGRLVQRHTGLLDPADTELATAVLTGRNTTARIERVDDPVRVRLENAAQATEIPGVDLSTMTPARRTAAIQALNADDCTCGCGLTLAECRINDPECTISLPLAIGVARRFAN